MRSQWNNRGSSDLSRGKSENMRNRRGSGGFRGGGRSRGSGNLPALGLSRKGIGNRGPIKNIKIGRKMVGKRKGKVIVEPHRFEGIYISKGKADSLVTKSMSPGVSVYGEKRLDALDADGLKMEYRVWNPFRSKLAASIVGGVGNMPIKFGSSVLYLGAANGTTVSHVSDVVGPKGCVYAVEFSHRSGRDLTSVAKNRKNIIPIIEDARQPQKYRMLVGMCDVIFADVAQPDQTRILGLNAEYFLKNGGWFIISIKANCVDSTASPEAVFACEINNLRRLQCRPREKLTLEPYHRNHAIVIGQYRVKKK